MPVIRAVYYMPYLMVFSLMANGATGNGGYGSVGMKGTVVASACSISLDSLDQHVDLGALPVNVVARDGKGPAHPLKIRLVDCEMFRPGQWDFSSVRVTFDGPRDEVSHLIRLNGDARGVGLLIRDHNGQTVQPGETLGALPLHDGVVDLDYTLAVEKNNDALLAGHYRTGVRFKVEYE